MPAETQSRNALVVEGMARLVKAGIVREDVLNKIKPVESWRIRKIQRSKGEGNGSVRGKEAKRKSHRGISVFGIHEAELKYDCGHCWKKLIIHTPC